jgi:hypothetical protein
MPVLMKLRGAELEKSAGDEIEAVRQRVIALLSPDTAHKQEEQAPPREGLSGMKENVAMGLLARRLAHIEYAAGKVARLAARPIIDEGAIG